MQIGHINLCKSLNGTGEHFVSLVESLQREGIEQHVLVRNKMLAKRLGTVDGVVVGPIVGSAVSAYCLMPRLDVVHIHDSDAGQAGLLLTLTRSMPFVLTHRRSVPISWNPLTQAVYRRAASIICMDDSDMAVLRHYDPLLSIHVVPDIKRSGSAIGHLRVYQNSQSTPIAGNSGIQ